MPTNAGDVSGLEQGPVPMIPGDDQSPFPTLTSSTTEMDSGPKK